MHRTQRHGILAAIIVLAATGPLAAQQTMSNDKAMAGNKTMAMGTRGTFSGAMNHAASGSYAVIGSGKDRKLELGNDFNVDQSSDVYVVLAKGMAKDQGSLDLGKLRKADGAQSFDIPESANLASFTSVLLWSKKDKAVIGEAALGSPAMARDSMMMKP